MFFKNSIWVYMLETRVGVTRALTLLHHAYHFRTGEVTNGNEEKRSRRVRARKEWKDLKKIGEPLSSIRFNQKDTTAKIIASIPFVIHLAQ